MQGRSGVHEVAQDETAIGPGIGGFFHVGQNQEDRRCAVHGVTRRAHDFGIEGTQAGQGIRVLDDDDGAGLETVAAGGIRASLEDQV